VAEHLSTHNYVYLAQRERDGAIKIGVSWSPWQRVKSLATKHKSPVELLAETEGGRRLESDLHWRFRAHAVPGENEWFTPAPEVLAYIAWLQASTYVERCSLTAPRSLLCESARGCGPTWKEP
jgi:hypothetical protein